MIYINIFKQYCNYITLYAQAAQKSAVRTLHVGVIRQQESVSIAIL